jgi:hypothetical protein
MITEQELQAIEAETAHYMCCPRCMRAVTITTTADKSLIAEVRRLTAENDTLQTRYLGACEVSVAAETEINSLTKERDEFAEDARRNDERIARLTEGNTVLTKERDALAWMLDRGETLQEATCADDFVKWAARQAERGEAT